MEIEIEIEKLKQPTLRKEVTEADKAFVENFYKFSDLSFTQSFSCPLVTFARGGVSK